MDDVYFTNFVANVCFVHPSELVTFCFSPWNEKSNYAFKRKIYMALGT